MESREDYFQFLPYETIEEIFMFLQPILAYWPSLARVCKDFRKVGKEGKRLWRAITIQAGHENCDHCDAIGRATPVKCVLNQRLLELLSGPQLFNVVKDIDISSYKPGIPMSLLKSPLFAGVERLCLRGTYIINDDQPDPEAMDIDTSGGEDEMIFAPNGEPLGKPIYWPSMKVLNLTNSSCDKLFALVVANNLKTLIVSGVRNACGVQLLEFIMRAKDTLAHVDISRTNLSEDDIEKVLSSCPKLEALIGTELRWRGVEDAYLTRYPKPKVILRLLSHWLEPIKKRRADVACLYDVDGRGCSLLADAIYVGIKLDVIKYIIDEFGVDINRFGCLPPPWVLPYPTKIVESFEQLRSPLGLHQALLLNKFDIASHLVSLGADPNKGGKDGLSAVQSLLYCPTLDATSRNNAINFLLELSGVRFDSITVRLCVERALPVGILERVAYTKIPDDDPQRNNFYLFCAAARDISQLVSLLIEGLGADPSAAFLSDSHISKLSTPSRSESQENSLLVALKNSATYAAEAILLAWSRVCGGGSRCSNVILYRDARNWHSFHYAIHCCPLDRLESLLVRMLSLISTAEQYQVRQEISDWAGVSASTSQDLHEKAGMLRNLGLL